MAKYRIGVDVGGTFTDFLILNDEGKSEIYKTPSTPNDPSVGFINGIKEIAKSKGIKAEDFLEDIDIIVHGTTVTTNAVITSDIAKTGLLTTKGFRDHLEMRRGVKEKPYDIKYIGPQCIVPRYLRESINERIDLEGKVITPLDDKDVRKAIRRFKEEGVEAVAICYMHSYANSDHEKRTKEILEEEFPEAYTTLSCEILPQIRLYERVSTTVFNSAVGPLLKHYLNKLTKELALMNYGGVLLIMQSNAGVMTPEVAIERPASTLLSGPAGAPVSGLVYAAVLKYDDFITIDMGGTSFDICFVRNRNPVITVEGKIDRRAMALPMVEIHTLGAGGGTVAYIDDGGMFRMGPASQGAHPGPACYNLGGEEPTCTDIDLILGYIDPDFFLGGRIKLYPELARRAVMEKIASRAGVDHITAAAGMHEVINMNMANGIRELTVAKGLDPREYPLICAGGGGPVHACAIALELEISHLIIPRESSVFCATGMLISDLRHDFVRTYHLNLSDADFTKFNAIFEEMEEEGRRLLRMEGVPEESIKFNYTLDLRYVGEYHEIMTPITLGEREFTLIESIADKFHALHDKLYGYQLKEDGRPLELINLRVSALGITPKPKFREEQCQCSDSSGAAKGKRPIYLTKGKKWTDAIIYDGEKLHYGNKIEGPAIVDLLTTTILILPEFNLLCDKLGSYNLYLPKKEAEVKHRLNL